MDNNSTSQDIIQSFGGPCHLSTIPLKGFYLFKIVESVISFCFKKIYNLTILNKWKSFSGMVDHVTWPPREPYNFSYFSATPFNFQPFLIFYCFFLFITFSPSPPISMVFSFFHKMTICPTKFQSHSAQLKHHR